MNGGAHAVKNASVGRILYEGRSTLLKAVTPEDYQILYKWRCSDDIHYLSSDPNTTVLNQFAGWLDHVREQNIVVLVINKQTMEPFGYVMTYEVDLWNGWAYWASYVDLKYRRSRLMVEALAATSTLLMSQFPFRKLYVEVYEFAARFGKFLVNRGYVEEGFTPAHSLVGGQAIGVWTYALYRETWMQQAPARSKRFDSSDVTPPTRA